MSTKGIKELVQERFINAFKMGLTHNNKVMSDIFKNTVLLNLPFFNRNINKILENFDLKYHEIFKSNKIKKNK